MIKKLFLSVLAILFMNTAFAKKVKFAVDMGSYTISPLGVHVMGNFQVAAGYSLNFDPATIPMNQVGATTIYTAMVTIPSFQVYEFKFVNGNQSYEVEFVPLLSRVDVFNDNRWFFNDSLVNDTTFLGNIPFSGNAPVGKTLIRYVVNMMNAGAIAASGVHVASTFQSMDPATHRMSNLNGTNYEIIAYVNTGVQAFKYFNGNNAGATETVPVSCATLGTRSFSLTMDTLLQTVCFSGCIDCVLGINETKIENSSLSLFPNPALDYVIIKNPGNAQKIIIVDLQGKKTDEIVLDDTKSDFIKLDLKKYNKGFYQLYLKSGNSYLHSKLIIQ